MRPGFLFNKVLQRPSHSLTPWTQIQIAMPWLEIRVQKATEDRCYQIKQKNI